MVIVVATRTVSALARVTNSPVTRPDEHQAVFFAVTWYFYESYDFNPGAHRADDHQGQRRLILRGQE